MDTRRDSQRHVSNSSGRPARRRKLTKRQRRIRKIKRFFATLIVITIEEIREIAQRVNAKSVLKYTAVAVSVIALFYAVIHAPLPDADRLEDNAVIEVIPGHYMTQKEYEEYSAQKAEYEEQEREESYDLIALIEEYQREDEARSIAQFNSEQLKRSNEKSGISCDWDADESYMLAKLAMAEAEGEDLIGKMLVIEVVINRVFDESFPGTIEEVIYARNAFSSIENGRYDSVEPDDDCYIALRNAARDLQFKYQEAQGATYFEATPDEGTSTWHMRNLETLFTHGGHTFYKEEEAQS